MAELLLSTKLKNLINAANPENNYEFNIHNILINGRKTGCSGFVTNLNNGVHVYVSTEQVPILANQGKSFMYRYCESPKDYTGLNNNFFADSPLTLASAIVQFAENREEYDNQLCRAQGNKIHQRKAGKPPVHDSINLNSKLGSSLSNKTEPDRKL